MSEKSQTHPGSASEYAMDFCVACYLPDAVPLIQGLLEQHAHDPSFRLVLTPGPSGSFEVRRDGQMMYSKAKSGRLPTHQDLGIPGATATAPQSTASGKPCC
jgi:selT/selW/selH-like putative selenoprotein